METTLQDTRAKGRCYCGGIEFEIHIPAGEGPVFTAYCHCDSCRRAHAAPLYHVVCVDEAHFRITEGEALLQPFTKTGGTITRAFCGQCGSRILNRFGPWRPGGKTPLAFFPNLLDESHQRDLPEMFSPKKHNRPEECVLDKAMLRDLLGS